MARSPDNTAGFHDMQPQVEKIKEGSIASLHFYPLKSARGIDTDTLEIIESGPVFDREFMIKTPDGGVLTQRALPAMTTISTRVEGENVIFSAKGHADLVVPPATGELTSTTLWKKEVHGERVGDEAAFWIQAVLGLSQGHELIRRSDQKPRELSQTWIDKPEATVSFADGYPILLTSVSSLKNLNTYLSDAVPMDRFRPNIVIDGFPPWQEDTWKVVKIGNIIFDVAKPCARCPIPSIDQETGEKPGKGDPMLGEPLRTLVKMHNIKTIAENSGTDRFNELNGGFFGWNLVPRTKGIITTSDKMIVLDYWS